MLVYNVPELLPRKRDSKASLSIQLRQLFWRADIFIKREPMAMKARLGQAVFMGILVSAVFWQLTSFTKEDISGLEGCMFMISTFMLMNNIMGTVLIF